MTRPADAATPLVRRPENPAVATTTLPNGLHVILAEHRRNPVAICQAWVRVGSNWEPAHLRGWSHGIEHMLFKGTERRAEGDFAREVAAAGGTTNAGTGYETTSYHITVPVENLRLACEIIADALFASRFDEPALDAERQVLVHENHMYDDVPFGFGITWRWALELALDRSPYRYPIGGQDEALLEAARDEILAFYRQAYRPENVIVVVAGDADAESMLAEVVSTFGAAPARPDAVPLAVPPVEPERRELRYRVERGDLKRAYAKLVFPGPGESAPERPALSVVRRLLADGRGCRLFERVREELQLVSDLALSLESGPREGVIVIDLESSPEQITAAIEATVAVLESLKSENIPETELARARVRALRAHHFGAETVQGVAARLGRHASMNDLAGAFDFHERVAAVTAADVAQLARDLFGRERMACLVYLPEDAAPDTVDLAADVGALETRLAPLLSEATPRPIAAAASRPGERRTAATAAAAALETTRPSFATATIAGGLRVHYRVDRTEPIWAAALLARGGATAETAENCGLNALAQQVQIKGAAGLAAADLHRRVESLGATIGARAERDFGGMVITGLRQDREKVFALLGDCACRPDFQDAEIERERRLALDQLAALADDPLRHAALLLREQIYGDHPYGRPLIGTEQSLPSLDREQLLADHAGRWRPPNLELVLAGDIEPDGDLATLEKVLSELPAGAASALPTLDATRRPDGVVADRIERQQLQCVLLLGWPGPPDPDTDRVPLLVLRELLNGQSGRLFEELRNRRSLCYSSGLLGTSGYGQGFLAAYVLTAPESESAARQALLDILSGIAADRVPAEELERARQELAGNLLIAHQANATRALRCARDLIYDRSDDDLPGLVEAIRSCEAEAVRDVAARYLSPQEYFEVVSSPRG